MANNYYDEELLFYLNTIPIKGFKIIESEELDHVSDVETFLFDIDSDGVKELHLRNGFYYILKEKEGKLTTLYEGTAAYDEPVEAMSGILHYREGGAPYNEVTVLQDLKKMEQSWKDLLINVYPPK